MECACSSADRVPGYEPVGRGFESPQARHENLLVNRQEDFFFSMISVPLGGHIFDVI